MPAPRSTPGSSGVPKAQPLSTAPPIAREKDRITVRVAGRSQRSARERPNSWVNAQTLVAEVAAAAITISLFRLGKGTCVQVDPFRSQAVALE